MGFSGWGHLELTTGEQYVGQIAEVDLFGAKMARVRVPNLAGPVPWKVEHYVGGARIGRFVPLDEAAVRKALAMQEAAARVVPVGNGPAGPSAMPEAAGANGPAGPQSDPLCCNTCGARPGTHSPDCPAGISP
jgi:hypothetical protein